MNRRSFLRGCAAVVAVVTTPFFRNETPRGIHVTNLNSDGPGSLRAALEHKSSKKIIIFDIEGIFP